MAKRTKTEDARARERDAALAPADRPRAERGAARVVGRTDVPGWGADQDPKHRPGVPKEFDPPHPHPRAHWAEPEPQESRAPHLVSVDRGRLTPVFGTASPPRGLSGALRRAAYRIPEHEARRALLLIAADRVDAYGSRARAHPVATGALLLGIAATARMLSGGRRRARRARPRSRVFA